MVMRGTLQSAGCCLVLYLKAFSPDSRRRGSEGLGGGREGRLVEKEEQRKEEKGEQEKMMGVQIKESDEVEDTVKKGKDE